VIELDPHSTPTTLAIAPTVHIRPFQLQDLNPLAKLLTETFYAPSEPWTWMQPLLQLGTYDDLKTRLQAPKKYSVCLVAIHPLEQGHERVTGTIEMSLESQCTWNPWGASYLYLSNLAVQTRYRRQGIAQKLLQRCEHIAQTWAFQDLYLHVSQGNQQARQLYEQAGYKLIRTDWHIGHLLFRQPLHLFLHKKL
jgi:ribosomal protein S18 acetylase RimI-like enzyme